MLILTPLHDVINASLAAARVPALAAILVNIGHAPRLSVLKVTHRAVKDVVLQQQRVIECALQSGRRLDQRVVQRRVTHLSTWSGEGDIQYAYEYTSHSSIKLTWF